MPFYLKEDDRQLLRKLKRRNVCAECGSELDALYDINKHLPYLVCSKAPGHEGIAREYQGPIELNIPTWRNEMVEEIGIEKTQQLAKYQGVTSLTRPQAMEIMEAIWPDAPEKDRVIAAILCVSYGLNPLANHIFLVPYVDNRTGETTWARIWGIKAKRLVASRKGNYSYLDMTPRLMTESEQMKVWGAVDTANLCYLTHLKDVKTGAEAYGYGKYPKNEQPKGIGKGNSQANMASIRSESQALDRLRPAEMPTGLTVVDEDYIDVSEVGRVLESTGEIIEGGVLKTEPAKAPVVASKIKPRAEWDKITREEVSTYPKLETIFHTLTDKQPKEMYAELGGGGRNDMTISAWDAFVTLRERFAPRD